VTWRKIVKGSRLGFWLVASSLGLGKKLIHRLNPSLPDVGLRLFQQNHPVAAGGEVLFNLPVPLLPVLLEEPCGQTSPFVLGKVHDLFLDGFQSHAYNVREMLRWCKDEAILIGRMMVGPPFEWFLNSKRALQKRGIVR